MSPVPSPPPAKLSLASLSYGPNSGRWRTEAMRSHDSARLLIFSKGHGRITIAGLTRGFSPNSMIFIPAHTMYGYESGTTVFGQILTIPDAMAEEWPQTHVHLRLRDVAAQKEAIVLLDNLERELSSREERHDRAALYHLGLLAVFFARQLDDHDMIDAQEDSTAARLVAAYTGLIERRFRSGEGVADYAAALGVTPTHLTRCCKQTCNKSALALLQDRRHFEACMMLRETSVPVKMIAEDLGYSSAAYFSRAFLAQSGTTPSQFRKKGLTQQRHVPRSINIY